MLKTQNRRKEIVVKDRELISAMSATGRVLMGVGVTGALVLSATPNVLAAPANDGSEFDTEDNLRDLPNDPETLVARLAETDQQLAQLQSQLQAKREGANKALVDLQMARTTAAQKRDFAATTKDELNAAQKRLVEAQKSLNRLAAVAYQTTSGKIGLQAIGGSNPEDLVRRREIIQQSAAQQRSVLNALELERTRTANKESAARQASEEATQAESSAVQRNEAAANQVLAAKNAVEEQQTEIQRVEQVRQQIQTRYTSIRPVTVEQLPTAGTPEAISKIEDLAKLPKDVLAQLGPDVWKRIAELAQEREGDNPDIANTVKAIAEAIAQGQLSHLSIVTDNPIVQALLPSIKSVVEPLIPHVTPHLPELADTIRKLSEGVPGEPGSPTVPGVPGGTTPAPGENSIIPPVVPSIPKLPVLPVLPIGNTARVELVVNRAMTQLGVPYSWGGGNAQGPTLGIRDGGVADSHGDYKKVGFDCSGLMIYAFAALGYSLPHYSGYQYTSGPQFPVAEMKRGDMVFFGPGAIRHVALYLGDGMMLEAPQSGSFVKVSPLRWNGMTSKVVRLA